MILTDRNYGIDLLRIISMMILPVLHVLEHGGVLNASITLSLNYCTAWFLNILHIVRLIPTG